MILGVPILKHFRVYIIEKILEYKTKVNQIVVDNYYYLNFTSTEKMLFEENIQ